MKNAFRGLGHERLDRLEATSGTQRNVYAAPYSSLDGRFDNTRKFNDASHKPTLLFGNELRELATG